MTRITPDHLSRAAWVYVRQSTPRQVRHNLESQGRQYALRDRAHQLGWSEVVVVDEDLGRSGGGTVRPGYDRLPARRRERAGSELAAVCRGEVGVVLSLEASRLARNGREWHTLLDYCGLVGCLLADESSVYDPRLPNDRLLLGMKGTMSEMELSTLRHRSEEALRRKAGRGELFMTVAVGYVRVDRDRIGMDPDQRVREAVALVFRKFAELDSIRQVHLWLRHEGIELPALVPGGSAQRIEWKLPVYNSIHHMLTNPVYAGAYAFGRTGTRTYLENGHKRVVHGIRRRRDEWEVLIRDHHDGYITWAEYERNQKVIADNANCQGAAARGSIRQGEALLAGLVRCGHCGRNLHVTYPGDQRSIAHRARCCAKRSWRSKRPASRSNTRGDNTMPWTRTTAWSPASWNGAGVPPGEALALTWELDPRRLEVNPVVGPGGRRLVTRQNRFHACGPRRCTYRGYSNELFALQDVGVDLGREGTRYTCRVQAVMDFPNEYHGHPEVMLRLRGVRQPRPARMYRHGRPLEPAGSDRRELIEGPR